MNIPLAHLLRPRIIDDVIGQRHLLTKNASLRKLIDDDDVSSMIFYGPPGCGKTCIAQIIADQTKCKSLKLNATSMSVTDVRKFAKEEGRKLLIIDECHRLSANQSDVLLPFVEDGTLNFIGATTENVFHAMSGPLISRSLIFQFEPLSRKDLLTLICKGLCHLQVERPNLTMDPDAALYVVDVSCGDGRKCITLFDLASRICENDIISLQTVKNVAPNKYMIFSEDLHYDYASAMQGSIQASDPDAAIYWLAKWLESGEDPRYVARRVLISAAEDAYDNPICTAVAHAAFIAAKEIGRPECDISLAQAVCLIATSKRDKSAACAMWSALKDVRESNEVWVPKEMRDAHYSGAKQLGQGAYHDGQNQFAYVGINKRYYYPEKWK
jgi:putative ATPase